jgi:hypothetical protein
MSYPYRVICILSFYVSFLSLYLINNQFILIFHFQSSFSNLQHHCLRTFALRMLLCAIWHAATSIYAVAFKFRSTKAGRIAAPPITVAAWSKVWTVSARSNTGIVCSNPTRGMDVRARLFCVCNVLCVGSGLVTGWSPVQGVNRLCLD